MTNVSFPRQERLRNICALFSILMFALCSKVTAQNQGSTTPNPVETEAAPDAKSAKTAKKQAGKRSVLLNLQQSSFRLIVPPLPNPKLEGLYEYSYRIVAPTEYNLEASLDNWRSTLSPEQYRTFAKAKLSEAERLRSLG